MTEKKADVGLCLRHVYPAYLYRTFLVNLDAGQWSLAFYF